MTFCVESYILYRPSKTAQTVQ